MGGCPYFLSEVPLTIVKEKWRNINHSMDITPRVGLPFSVCTLSVSLQFALAGDEIRRVTVECVVPMVTGTCMKRKHNLKHEDILLAEYDQFDDYLEMVVQFGVSKLSSGDIWLK